MQFSSRSSVYNFLTTYAADHPDEQLEMINWLTGTLVNWVDVRALNMFADKLPTAVRQGKLPKLEPVIY